MPPRKRKRIADGVYEDGYGLAATIKVGRQQRERRFPPDFSLDVIQAWRARTRADLLEERDERREDSPEPAGGSFERDADRYLKAISHRVGYKADRSHLKAWYPHVGHLKRSAIRPAQVQAIITLWDKGGVSPQTIKHRVRAFRAVYRRLDRQHARPPVKGVELPRLHAPHPVAVPWAKVQQVAKSLTKSKRHKGGFGGETKHGRARFLVLATTGQRPAQLMRATAADVDLRRRIWFVRGAKDGHYVTVPLDASMVAAWKAFIKADAWGEFNTTNFTRLLRRHGWPEGIRPYNLRHTLAIDMILGGADLSDVQAALGHRQIQTTRESYAPMQLARLRKALRLRRRAKLA